MLSTRSDKNTMPRRGFEQIYGKGRRALAGRSGGVWAEDSGEAEGWEQARTECGDLGDHSVARAQHVELEGAELRVARPAQIAGCGRHPVGRGRHEPPVAVSIWP